MGPEAADEQPIRLRIAQEGPQRRDRLVIRAEVRNNSKEAFGWDREFATFLRWQLAADGLHKLLDPDIITAKVAETGESLAKRRFVKVEPGGTISKVVILTEPFRTFGISAWGGSRESRHPSHFEGFEAMWRYSIGPSIGKVTVVLIYSRYGEDAPAFKTLFGFDPNEVGLPNQGLGRYKSNELKLSF